MKKPEWKKELDEHKTLWNDETALRLANHIGHDSKDPNGKIHRGIYVSTLSPTNAEGNDGDIWFVIE